MDAATTITVRREVKERLAQAKGSRSWDDFLEEVADQYLEQAIALAEERLAALKAHKAKARSLLDLNQAIQELPKEGRANARRRTRTEGRAVDPADPRGGVRRTSRPRS